MIKGYQPVAHASEIKPGEKKIVNVKGKELGIFNIDGKFHAFLNQCPHMGAPLCNGSILKKIASDKPGTFIYENKRVLRCPWHRWEFDIESGTSNFDDSICAKKYDVKVRSGTVYCKI